MTLAGYRFVVTGGASGIGAATARLAASRGAHVFIGDLDADAAAATVSSIEAAGGRAGSARLDVGEVDSIDAFVDEAAETLGGIDVLHNNAGVADAMLTSSLSLTELPLDVWDTVMRVNLRGPLLCTRAAYPHLKASGRGSVVMAGSVGSVTGFPHTLAYGASKGGIHILTKNLAVELAPDGIRVNCYGPGVTETAMATRYLDAQPDPAQARIDMARSHLVPRLGLPEDIAQVVCFLAGPESSFVNGTMVLVDGGQLAWRGVRD